jgi:hypothetical protein
MFISVVQANPGIGMLRQNYYLFVELKRGFDTVVEIWFIVNISDSQGEFFFIEVRRR